MKIEALNCPNCGAAVSIASAHCRFCTSKLKTMAYTYSPLNEAELTSRLMLMIQIQASPTAKLSIFCSTKFKTQFFN
ncbi:MAG: hypothetical protein H0X15_01425 [Acidobacteria bacterium]|jgi:hypothetical protein|nr:hypothetical protein [Acidobacteriota bacterium]MBA4121913.1 hypothetical protein [Acidobacteriota bacterium]